MVEIGNGQNWKSWQMVKEDKKLTNDKEIGMQKRDAMLAVWKSLTWKVCKHT